MNRLVLLLLDLTPSLFGRLIDFAARRGAA